MLTSFHQMFCLDIRLEGKYFKAKSYFYALALLELELNHVGFASMVNVEAGP